MRTFLGVLGLISLVACGSSSAADPSGEQPPPGPELDGGPSGPETDGSTLPDAGPPPVPCVTCDGQCVDTATNDAHCGECGHVCTGATGCFGGKCQTPAPMPTPRWEAMAITGIDGRIYVVGGKTGKDPTPIVEAYDPRTNAWKKLAPMRHARQGHVLAVGPEGLLYAIAGLSSANVEVYDYTNDTWSNGLALPLTLEAHSATFGPDGKLYVFGGMPPFGDLSDYDDSKAVYVWDPANPARWALQGMAPVGRHGAASALVDGRFFVIAGGSFENGKSTPIDRVDVFEFASGTWSSETAFPTPGSGLHSFPSEKGVLVFGNLAASRVYEGKVWKPLVAEARKRRSYAAAKARDGRIFFFGGTHPEAPTTPVGSVVVYRPTNDTFVE